MAEFTITSHASTFLMSGEPDVGSAPVLATTISQHVAHDTPITLDLRDMRFVDSSGASAILKAAQAMPADCLLLHGAKGLVDRELQIAGMDHVANIHRTPCSVKV